MKLPWVSRLAYEAMERALAHTRDDLLNARAEVLGERMHYTALVERMTEMQREGFVAMPEYPEAAAAQQVAPPVLDALDRIGLQGSARAQMLAWAERQMAKGTKPEMVAQELLAGGLSDARAM